MVSGIIIHLGSKILKMKKFVLFAVLLAAGFTSCSKDDDNQQETSELVGKWEFTQQGSTVMGTEFLEPYEHTEGCAKDFLQFAATTVADHTFYGSNCAEEITTDAYTRVGNTLTIVEDGEIFTVEILMLNATTLKLKVFNVSDGTTSNYINVLTRK